jgi:hypothetical protein
MNTLTIFLGVLLVIIIFYFTFNSGSQELSQKLDLGSGAQTPIKADTLDQPGSAKYSYEMWVYVYQAESAEQYIISRESGVTGIKNIGIKIAGGQPKLELEYTSDNAKKLVAITDNLPLQTWVHLIVSVDGNGFIDAYINGKLVKSFKDAGIDTPSSTTDIVYGNAKCYLAKLTRTTKATDPQTAWDKYMAGNGENPFAKYLSSFGLTMTLQKNNQDYSKVTFF